jgi:hypothetical protein
MLSLPFQGRFLPLMQGVSEWQAFPSPEVILLVALHKFATRRSPSMRCSRVELMLLIWGADHLFVRVGH